MRGMREAIADNALDAFVEDFYTGIGRPVPELSA
jgi:queuine tRNA-ribosyltransferase